MQRVVILFVGILSVVRATPFDPDSVNQPTPFRFEFGNNVFSGVSKHADGYEIGAFESGENSNFIDESELEEIIGKLDFCNKTEELPEDGCIFIDEDGIHYINILTEDNIDDFERVFKNHGVKECIFDEEDVLIIKDPCYVFDEVFDAIHFYNYPLPREDVQDDDEPETGNGNLKQPKHKGIFNERPSAAKEAKAFLPKKIQSKKQLKEVQQKLGRRGHRHGNNGGRVSVYRPKWMKYLQKTLKRCTEEERLNLERLLLS